MSWRGFAKRVKSPTSATSTTAVIKAIPRIAIADKPFAMLSHARACARAAAENLEDADGLGSRFVARHSADGSNRAWLRDRDQGPRRASTRRLGEDALAWWRHDDWSSPDRRAWSESMTAPLHRSDGRGW